MGAGVRQQCIFAQDGDDSAAGRCFWSGVQRRFFSFFRNRAMAFNFFTHYLECVSKIPEYAISGVAAPFLRHKARLSAAKPSDLFLELTKNPLGSADCPA